HALFPYRRLFRSGRTADAPRRPLAAFWRPGPRRGGDPSLLGRRRGQHGAVAVVLRRGHHARRLHRLAQPRGAVVADLEPALDTGNGGAARLGDDLHGLGVERVGLVSRTATSLRPAGRPHDGPLVTHSPPTP